MITVVDKLPVWFRWVLVGLILALIGCIVYIRNTAVDVRIDKQINAIETIDKKQDSFVKQRNDKLDALVAGSAGIKKKSKELVKKLPYEKNIVVVPGVDSIDRYITNYRYAD